MTSSLTVNLPNGLRKNDMTQFSTLCQTSGLINSALHCYKCNKQFIMLMTVLKLLACYTSSVRVKLML